MVEHTLRDLYRRPSVELEGVKREPIEHVFVQYTPQIFYFALGGRFSVLNDSITKRRRRRLLGRLKHHVRKVKQFIATEVSTKSIS